jgi:alkyl sulfatase BDS1-like metallo-beta-lactamase superfamily hydrolase
VPALGGRDNILQMATQAVASDPQWAARLATYLLLVDDTDEQARQLRQQASIRFAQVTTSTNQRNYLLGLVAEENGDINFDRMLAGPITLSLQSIDDSELLSRLRSRVIAENADNVDIAVRLVLTDGETFDLHLINNILRVSWPDQERAMSGQWKTDRQTIMAILTNELSMMDALSSGRIQTSGNLQRNQRFASLFE